MSKAFTRESDDAPEPSPSLRPATVLPPGTKNYMTAGGMKRLRAEWDRWKDLLATATGPGADAERTRAMAESRILQLQRILDSAVVVPPAAPDNKVRFGATVTVRARSGEITEYRIVGVDETDADRDWVSWLSPVAKALTGKSVGDRVRIRLPAGDMELEITGIHYQD
ncbi:MAG: GreA/GreB family elongation factor [Verrucomicrobiales bacterium]|nr:GreA/GreB family elongation factor [Verrucomicrobiales bacterium]